MEKPVVDPPKKKEKRKTDKKKNKSSTTTTVGHDLTIKKHQLRTDDVKCKRTTEFSDFCLKKEILEGLNKSGFCYPSPIQELAIPVARMGADVIVQAKSGTGKTCVFSVIALENLNVQSKHVQVLILAPTREIAIQIYEVTLSIGQCLSGLEIGCFIGGTNLGKDMEKLKNCHIAVGTPGRVQDLIRREALKTSNIRLLVLDEADNLINKVLGHNEKINWIFSVLPDFKQMIAASATYPDHLEEYIKKYMKEPQQARLNPQHKSLLGLKQYYVVAKSQEFRTPQLNEKVTLLHNFLKHYKFNQALVFANSHINAQFINKQLSILKWPAAYISSQMEQERRNEAVRRLKNFQCRILISTDLTSRGVDAKKVDCVVNFDVPFTWATYMHRIGRAGRFGGSGTALTIVSPTVDQKAFCQMVKLCNLPIHPYPDAIYKDGYRQIIRLQTDNTELPPSSLSIKGDGAGSDDGWQTKPRPQKVEVAYKAPQVWSQESNKSTTNNGDGGKAQNEQVKECKMIVRPQQVEEANQAPQVWGFTESKNLARGQHQPQQPQNDDEVNESKKSPPREEDSKKLPTTQDDQQPPLQENATEAKQSQGGATEANQSPPSQGGAKEAKQSQTGATEAKQSQTGATEAKQSQTGAKEAKQSQSGAKEAKQSPPSHSGAKEPPQESPQGNPAQEGSKESSSSSMEVVRSGNEAPLQPPVQDSSSGIPLIRTHVREFPREYDSALSGSYDGTSNSTWTTTSSSSSSDDDSDSDLSSTTDDSDVSSSSSDVTSAPPQRGGIPDMSDILRESDKFRGNTHLLQMNMSELEADMRHMIVNNAPLPPPERVVTSYPSSSTSADEEEDSDSVVSVEAEDDFKSKLGEYVPVIAADESSEEEEVKVEVKLEEGVDGDEDYEEEEYYDEDGEEYYDEDGEEYYDEEYEEGEYDDEEELGTPVGEQKNLRNYNDGVQYLDPSLDGKKVATPTAHSSTTTQQHHDHDTKQRKEKKQKTAAAAAQQQPQPQMIPNPYCYYHHHLAHLPPPCICSHHPPMTSQHPPMTSPHMYGMYQPPHPSVYHQSPAALYSHPPVATPSYRQPRGGAMSREEHARYVRDSVMKFTNKLLSDENA